MDIIKHKYGPLPLWAWLIVGFITLAAIGGIETAVDPNRRQAAIVQPTSTTVAQAQPTHAMGLIIPPTSILVAATQPTRSPVTSTPVPRAMATVYVPSTNVVRTQPTTTVDQSPIIVQPASLSILQHQHYTGDVSGLTYVGLVKNTGAKTAENIVVQLTLLDSNGNELATAMDNALINTILPAGKSVGFTMDVSNPPAKWAKEDIKVTGDVYDAINNDLYNLASNLRVVGDTISPGQGGMVVAGEIKNSGAKTTQLVYINITAYDAAGNVVDAIGDVATGYNGIAPGQSVAFQMPLLRPNVSIARYETLVSAYEK